MGAQIVVIILSLVIGGYALAIIGLIVIGVMANTVISGDVTVPNSTNTAVVAQLANFEALVTTVLNPYTTIAALVVVAVLLAIFFKGKMPGSGSSVN